VGAATIGGLDPDLLVLLLQLINSCFFPTTIQIFLQNTAVEPTPYGYC
jgi:hypothetical protein